MVRYKARGDSKDKQKEKTLAQPSNASASVKGRIQKKTKARGSAGQASRDTLPNQADLNPILSACN